MKKIPRKYPNATFKSGVGLPTVSYFQTSGIFLHFWGLFEWVVSNVIWSRKTEVLKILDSKIDPANKKDPHKKMKEIIKKCRSTQDIFFKKGDWLKTWQKLKILDYLEPSILKSTNSSNKLRDAIAHNHVTFVGVNIGAIQFEWGYIKGDTFDKETTEEYRNTMKKIKKSNPKISDQDLNAEIWLTYSEQDIINEIETLIQAIGDLGYDIESDNIYIRLRHKGFLK